MSIRRVSTTDGGRQASHVSHNPLVSADGRFVVFTSMAEDLVPGDDNRLADVFVKTLANGEIRLVSTAADGSSSQGTIPYYSPTSSVAAALSADARFVVFTSHASNLVAGDTNGATDVFRKDLQTGDVIRVNTTVDGGQSVLEGIAWAISPDGRFVVFGSGDNDLVPGDTTMPYDVFVKDLRTGTIQRASIAADSTQPDNASIDADISADGRYVVFTTYASNLAPGDDRWMPDVFRKDLQTGALVRVSAPSDGTVAGTFGGEDPSVSADGRYVLFTSISSNLVAGDTNRALDVFVKDMQTGVLERVSTAADGTQADGGSHEGQISDDGRWATFRSAATNLVPGDHNRQDDIFVKDLWTGEVKLVSLADSAQQANGDSFAPTISADGRVVAFGSAASTLVALDSNGLPDVFAVDVATVPIRGEDAGVTGWGTKGSDVIGSAPESQLPHLPVLTPEDDWLDAGWGDDTVSADAGDDTLDGRFGDDCLSGDDGDDVLLGGSGDDVLLAGSGDDLVRGGTGFDSISGGNGRDTIIGGAGRDTLAGGGDADVFLFTSPNDSTRQGYDALSGFHGVGVAGGDRIDLRAMDADTTRAGDQAFAFLGAGGPFDAPGQLRLVEFFGHTMLQANVDPDPTTIDFAVVVLDGTEVAAADYAALDFVL